MVRQAHQDPGIQPDLPSLDVLSEYRMAAYPKKQGTGSLSWLTPVRPGRGRYTNFIICTLVLNLPILKLPFENHRST
jgi:hypothetical protein